MIYLCNVISIITVGIFSKRFGKYADKFFGLFCLIQMTIITGLRYQVGADWYSYERIYERVGQMTLENWDLGYIEVGYALLNKIFYSLKIPYWGLNLTVAFITYFFVIEAIKVFSPHMVLSVYLYISFFFFCQSMNQTRQMLAISVGLYAIAMLCKGESRKFFAIVILATTFHISLFLLLPLYWLKKIQISKRIVIFYFVIPVLVVIFYEVFVKIISYTKYAVYFNSQYDVQGATSTLMNLAVRLVMLLFALLMCKKVVQNEEKNCLYHMIIICTVLQVLTTYSALFGRATTNFYIAYIILIPKIIEAVGIRKYKTASYIVCVLIASLYHWVYFKYTGQAVGVNHYSNYLFM